MIRLLTASLLMTAAAAWAPAAHAAPSKKKVKQTAKKCKENPEACADEAAAAAGLTSGKKSKKSSGAAPTPPKAATPSSKSNLVDRPSSSSSSGGKLHNGSSTNSGGKLNNNGGSSSGKPKEPRSNPPPPKGGTSKKKKHSKKRKGGGAKVKRHKDGRRGRLGLSGAPRVSVTEQSEAAAVISYGGEFDLFYRVKGKLGPLFSLNVETDGVDAAAGVILGGRAMLSPKQKLTPIADLGLAIQGVPGWESSRVGPTLRAGVDYAVKKNTSLSFLVGGALYVNQPEKEPSSIGALHVGIMLTGWP
jgi:hypothetical protein